MTEEMGDDCVSINPIFLGNIRVTVTFENSMGERHECFAISGMDGQQCEESEFEDIMHAKCEAAAMAAVAGITKSVFRKDLWP